MIFVWALNYIKHDEAKENAFQGQKDNYCGFVLVFEFAWNKREQCDNHDTSTRG